jgi:hypothetical protein
MLFEMLFPNISIQTAYMICIHPASPLCIFTIKLSFLGVKTFISVENRQKEILEIRQSHRKVFAQFQALRIMDSTGPNKHNFL